MWRMIKAAVGVLRRLLVTEEPAVVVSAVERRLRHEAELLAAGWVPWLDPYRVGLPSPYRHELVETTRATMGAGVTVLSPREMHPLTNVAGLFWRPWRGRTIETRPANRLDGPYG